MCSRLERVYGAAAWQCVVQIRYNIKDNENLFTGSRQEESETDIVALTAFLQSFVANSKKKMVYGEIRHKNVDLIDLGNALG
jgi:hypothetical protein